MIAFVLGVIAASRSAASRLRSCARRRRRRPVSHPTSATTFAAATKLSDGKITSSPSPHPTASRARCSAAVPFATASACGRPVSSANCALELRNARPHAPPARRRTSRPTARSSSSTSTSESGTRQRGLGHGHRVGAPRVSKNPAYTQILSPRWGTPMTGTSGRKSNHSGGWARPSTRTVHIGAPKATHAGRGSRDRRDHRRPPRGERDLRHHALRRLPRPSHRGTAERSPADRKAHVRPRDAPLGTAGPAPARHRVGRHVPAHERRPAYGSRLPRARRAPPALREHHDDRDTRADACRRLRRATCRGGRLAPARPLRREARERADGEHGHLRHGARGAARTSPKRRYFDFPELVQALLDEGMQVGTFPFTGFWLDIGRRDDYELALDYWHRNDGDASRQPAEGLVTGQSAT